jgi:hypothetical protein
MGGIKPPTKKDPTYCNIKPNLHKRNHLLTILNAKTNPTCLNKGVACKFQRTIDHGNKGQSKSLPIKIQIAGCCCLHEQAIQSILTTPTHPNSQKISKNKKRYKGYKEKDNLEVGGRAMK